MERIDMIFSVAGFCVAMIMAIVTLVASICGYWWHAVTFGISILLVIYFKHQIKELKSNSSK